MADALADLMSFDRMRRNIELGVTRSRRWRSARANAAQLVRHSDEAQNTTVRQMKMFYPADELARGDYRRHHADRLA
jgi:phosphate starvation-inducible protein PhoH